MTRSAPIIAVTGATGAQGRGLVRAILDDPEQRFAVRAVTRTPGSPAARALAAHGAEVVRADLDDADSLTAAFLGAQGAFCLAGKLNQAANLAEACARACVMHAVFATLEDPRASAPFAHALVPTTLLHRAPDVAGEDVGRYTFGLFDDPMTIGRTVTVAPMLIAA